MTLQEFLSKFDTINVREYRRDNQKWTIQRNSQHSVHKINKRQRIPKGQSNMDNQKWTIQRNWQHSVHKINKRQRIPKGQSNMDNPEKLATQCTQDK